MFRRIALVLVLLFSTFPVSGTSPVVSLSGQINNTPQTAVATTITTTGTQAALAIPSGTGNLVIFANNASLLTIQGIAAGIDGQRLTIYSVGAGQVDLVAQSTGATTAALRLVNFVGNSASLPTSLAPGSGVADYIYNVTIARWLLNNHEQGAPISVAWASGNFTASAGTWTVDVGDLNLETYYLKGKQLTISIKISTASISNAGAVALLAMPGGFTTPEVRFFPAILRGTDNVTSVNGMVGTAGTAFLQCYVGFGGGGWQVQTNLMNLEFDIIVAVT